MIDNPKVLIISIGDELIFHQKINTTAPKIAHELTKIGFNDLEINTISDSGEKIKQILKQTQAQIIITTGGIGPTEDDLTVFSVADALNVSLIKDLKHENFLKGILKNRKVTDLNSIKRFTRQALYPEGFILEKSPFGSAGFIYRFSDSKDKKIFLLPGVPNECIGLIKEKVIPKIKSLVTDKPNIYLEMKIISVSETEVETKIKNILCDLKKFPKNLTDQIKVAFLPSNSELLVRIGGKEKLKQTMLDLRKTLKKTLSDKISYFSNQKLSEYLHHRLTKNKLKIGLVESCTGGLIASEMIQYPGSSNYLDSALVSYSGSSKIDLAKVKKLTLAQFGEVSQEIALEMAHGYGVRRGLDLCLSVTGVAGPGGGSATKPVGLVYLGIYYNNQKKTIKDYRKFNFKGNRNSIRKKTVKQGLIFIIEVLKENKLL